MLNRRNSYSVLTRIFVITLHPQQNQQWVAVALDSYGNEMRNAEYLFLEDFYKTAKNCLVSVNICKELTL